MAVHDWVEIVVKVAREPDNAVEGDGWRPSSEDVAVELRERLENHDFDTGWIITKVSVL